MRFSAEFERIGHRIAEIRHSRHYGWHENKAIYEEFRSLRQSPTDFDVMMHGIVGLEKHINA